ncbi:uncharacterized protein PgNI_07451 [Pyricularia grisea]|uniref:Uncharacterized protein n=1 Tax=Pyricularia grisea TaxID=148305 RepID=A0A6P8B272_PYRGI|nr:uncharacterized protein PgNI_07451 [Pyricularia grisea]TLD08995.1 hypothetical protein PgNI_07451 [Pyricularia grisea]
MSMCIVPRYRCTISSLPSTPSSSSQRGSRASCSSACSLTSPSAVVQASLVSICRGVMSGAERCLAT